jgi:hypothetical protein
MDHVVFIIVSDLFQVSLLVVVVFVVGVIVVVEGEVAVEEEVALAEVPEVVVEDEGDLVAGAVEEVGEEEEDEDVEVVGIFLHLGTFELVSILTVSWLKFVKMLFCKLLFPELANKIVTNNSSNFCAVQQSLKYTIFNLYCPYFL